MNNSATEIEKEQKLPEGTCRRTFVFEILACAKPNCKTCTGIGVFSMTNDPKVAPHEEVCGCAVRRFIRAHGSDVMTNNKGELYWLTGHDPRAEEFAAALAASAIPVPEQAPIVEPKNDTAAAT